MRLAWETIRQAYREALGRDDVVPGVIAGIQTFGALAHFHTHVHTIATDGALVRDTADSNLPSPPPAQRNRGGEGRLRGLGQFICTPPLDMENVRRLWEDRVFHLLLEAGKIAGSGSFSCRTPTNDSPTNDNGKKRCLTPSARSQTDNSSGNDNPPHIDRRLLEEAKTDATRRRRARSWAALIQRVCEVDPLKCIKCGGQMRIVSFIEARQEEVIRQILKHCGHWHGPPRRLPPARPPPAGRRPPPPCEVQLVLDPEFVAARSTVGSCPAGRRLVLDPEYRTDRPSDAGTQQQVVPYDGTHRGLAHFSVRKRSRQLKNWSNSKGGRHVRVKGKIRQAVITHVIDGRRKFQIGLIDYVVNAPQLPRN